MEDFEFHKDGVESLLFKLKADFLLVGVRRENEGEGRDREGTFMAMRTFVGLCKTLRTVP